MIKRTYKRAKKLTMMTRKSRKLRVRKLKSRKLKSRNLRGGIRYGTGVGSNCNEPNYSIFNTNLLKLFPYKP